MAPFPQILTVSGKNVEDDARRTTETRHTSAIDIPQSSSFGLFGQIFHTCTISVCTCIYLGMFGALVHSLTISLRLKSVFFFGAVNLYSEWWIYSFVLCAFCKSFSPPKAFCLVRVLLPPLFVGCAQRALVARMAQSDPPSNDITRRVILQDPKRREKKERKRRQALQCACTPSRMMHAWSYL